MLIREVIAKWIFFVFSLMLSVVLIFFLNCDIGWSFLIFISAFISALIINHIFAKLIIFWPFMFKGFSNILLAIITTFVPAYLGGVFFIDRNTWRVDNWILFSAYFIVVRLLLLFFYYNIYKTFGNV